MCHTRARIKGASASRAQNGHMRWSDGNDEGVYIRLVKGWQVFHFAAPTSVLLDPSHYAPRPPCFPRSSRALASLPSLPSEIFTAAPTCQTGILYEALFSRKCASLDHRPLAERPNGGLPQRAQAPLYASPISCCIPGTDDVRAVEQLYRVSKWHARTKRNELTSPFSSQTAPS